MSFFGFGQSVEVEILLNDAESRKRAEHKTEDGKKEKYFLFYDGETVSGKVSLALKNPNKRLEHQGIKIEFIGQIELYYDRGNHHEFVSLVKDLARPGEISQSQAFDFEFTHVEKPYESYTGQNVKLRYFLRATISRRLNDVVKEMDIVVHTLSTYPELNSSIKMEVGIEDCLHIEFEYNKSKYHLKDVIVGKIYFLLVRIKIKHMEIDIIKRETTGTGPNVYHENDTIAKYEIMDGAPVRGESIPIRLFLAGYELTPTMRDINKKFSVRYYLNLVLIDEEERRYFKQQEVVLWRKGDIVRKSMSHQAAIASQRFEGTTSLGEPTFSSPGPAASAVPASLFRGLGMVPLRGLEVQRILESTENTRGNSESAPQKPLQSKMQTMRGSGVSTPRVFCGAHRHLNLGHQILPPVIYQQFPSCTTCH
uniref:VPS26, retromer complex component B n=1 Tax=Suricata suricatta TaxID=37032 RepID=A0A673TWX1_SURSU